MLMFLWCSDAATSLVNNCVQYSTPPSMSVAFNPFPFISLLSVPIGAIDGLSNLFGSNMKVANIRTGGFTMDGITNNWAPMYIFLSVNISSDLAYPLMQCLSTFSRLMGE